MKIYGNPMSTCTRKVLATLAEKQAKFEMVTLDLMAGDHKKPAHLALQPFGQVPVMQDGDFTLYESRAIIRYLDETLPGQALTPKNAKGRAVMEQWISVETSNFTPHAMTYIYQYVFAPMRGGQPDMAKIEAAKPKLETCLAIMDKQLAKTPHIAGEQFSLADVCYMPYVEYVMGTPGKDVFSPHANVGAWWKRVSERASWKTASGK